MAEASAAARRRVLVVEDEPLLALYLEDLLHDLGWDSCGVACTQDQAVRLAQAHRPALAFVDIGLRGGVDGIALARELRRRFGTPVVFLSGAADAHTMQRAETAEPLAFITKPYVQADLEVVLQAATTGASKTSSGNAGGNLAAGDRLGAIDARMATSQSPREQSTEAEPCPKRSPPQS